jgi:hypothetical protein
VSLIGIIVFTFLRVEKTVKQSLTANTCLAMLRDINHNPDNKKFIMATTIRIPSPASAQQLLKIHAAKPNRYPVIIFEFLTR